MTWQIQQSDCAPSENSGLPGHPSRLIWVSAVRSKGTWGPQVSTCGQRRFWSDWADTQADLSIRWGHTHFVRFVMSRLICNITTTEEVDTVTCTCNVKAMKMLTERPRECHNGKPQPNPDTKRKRKKTDVSSCKIKTAHIPALCSPSEVIKMQNRTEKKTREKEQSKTQHEAPSSKNHNVKQNKNNTRTTVLERSVA